MTEPTSKFTITLDGVDYDVVAEGAKIKVNGRPFTVEAGGDGVVLVDGIAYEVALARDKAHVEGTPHTIDVAGLPLQSGLQRQPGGSPLPSRVEAGDGAVVAIMPGKVTRVLVEEGQEVEEGQPVCVLEAMKMENELRADRDGVVKQVDVSPGDDVEKGQVLVDIA